MEPPARDDDGETRMNRNRSNARDVLALAAALALVAACRGDGAGAASANEVSDAAPAAPTTAAFVATAATTADPVMVKVYKDPNCGCCNKWIEHLKENGFKVEPMDMPDLSLLKQKHGVTDTLQSCHTAIVNDYVIEGHVPADVIRQLLREKPAVAGLAVPGMPTGSPGMEGATKENYDILTFDRAGRTKVYAQR